MKTNRYPPKRCHPQSTNYSINSGLTLLKTGNTERGRHTSDTSPGNLDCASVPYEQRIYKMAAVPSNFPKLTNLWTNHLRCFHLSALLSHIRFLKRPVCTSNDYNPILNQESLPRFNEIRPSHVAAFYVGYAEDLRRGFPNRSAYWRTIVIFGAKWRKKQLRLA